MYLFSSLHLLYTPFLCHPLPSPYTPLYPLSQVGSSLWRGIKGLGAGTSTHHSIPFMHPLYTFITTFTPMYTHYTCIYTIYTPPTPLNTLYTPYIHHCRSLGGRSGDRRAPPGECDERFRRIEGRHPRREGGESSRGGR